MKAKICLQGCVPAALWMAFSFFLSTMLPCDSPYERIFFSRFHAFSSVFFSFAWVLWNEKESWRCVPEGLLAIFAGMAFLDVVLLDIPDSFKSLKPNFFHLSVFLAAYFLFLFAFFKFLRSFRPIRPWASFVFFALFSFSIAGLFSVLCSPDGVRKEWTVFCLHINPMVALSRCFPGYDYLRGYVFYELLPITSFLGPFSYPSFWEVTLAYAFLALSFSVLSFFGKTASKK